MGFNSKWLLWGGVALVLVLAVLGFMGVLPGPADIGGWTPGDAN